MDFLKINGGHGEGGGQIIRTAVTLSCITKKPIHIENIRKNRKVSGLKPQHLTAIKILQKITNADVTGAEIGSTELKFIPNNIESLQLVAEVGTAGSISLILQVLIPVIATSQKKLDLKIKGGTDVLWSPSFDYTQHILREAFARMGIEFSLELHKRGYYPKGGGEIDLHVKPSKIKSVSFTKKKTKEVKMICTFSKLLKEDIENEVNEIKEKLVKDDFTVNVEIKNQDAINPGASLLIFSTDENSVNGIDGLYDKETRKFSLNLNEFYKNSFGVDENLADMIVLVASLGPKKTIFHVKDISKHLETNLFVTSKITGCRYGIGKIEGGFEVIIEGISYSSIK